MTTFMNRGELASSFYGDDELNGIPADAIVGVAYGSTPLETADIDVDGERVNETPNITTIYMGVDAIHLTYDFSSPFARRDAELRLGRNEAN